MNMKEIGARIKNRRETLNISAEELGEMIGVHKATIHRYENGDFKSMKLPVIESIAFALEVNPSWLVGKSEIMEPIKSPISTQREVVSILDEAIRLLKQPDVTLDRRPVTPEAIQSIVDSMMIGLEMARKHNQ